MSTAERLAGWAHGYRPTTEDLDLAHRALFDTVAVTLAARDSRMRALVAGLPDAARWAAVGHVLDFDDLHLPSTAHIRVVCVPATLLDGTPAFTDAAVNRPEAQRLLRTVEVVPEPGGTGLLDGSVEIELTASGATHHARLGQPPGSPLRPPTEPQLRGKLAACGVAHLPESWADAAELLGKEIS